MYDGLVNDTRAVTFRTMAQHLLDFHGIYEPAVAVHDRSSSGE